MQLFLVMTTAYTHQQGGLTLVEALTALAILSILAAIAPPQFRELHERWQVTQAVRAMESSLMLARSEAIRRGGGIGMRKFGNEPGGCQNAGTNQEWGCGWFIYEDVNGNGSWNKTQDRILHELRLTGSVNVMHNSGGVNIKFDRYGKASGLNAKGFKFLPERTGTQSSYAQTLCMSSGGRIRIIKDYSDCKK